MSVYTYQVRLVNSYCFCKTTLTGDYNIRVYLPSLPSQLVLYVRHTETLNAVPNDHAYLPSSPSQLVLFELHKAKK